MARGAQTLESRSTATYQDVIADPEHKVAEIIDGVLYLSPRPGPRAGYAKQELLYQLFKPFDRGVGGPGGWWLLREPELHFGADVLVPDLVGWRRSRLPVLPEGPGVGIPPDWVCETLTPVTRALNLIEKRRVYARAGIPHLWQIDHEARVLEAFILDSGLWRLVAALKDDDEVCLAPFEAVTFSLSELWPD